MKLNAYQIGVLAVLLEQVLKVHPIPPPNKMVCKTEDSRLPEPWELELISRLERMPDMPKYHELIEPQNVELLEMLLEYFSEPDVSTTRPCLMEACGEAPCQGQVCPWCGDGPCTKP